MSIKARKAVLGTISLALDNTIIRDRFKGAEVSFTSLLKL
jgi:hypothetical protein